MPRHRESWKLTPEQQALCVQYRWLPLHVAKYLWIRPYIKEAVKEFRDLIGMGNLGLIRAAHGYRPDHLVKGKPVIFKTYAFRCIYQAIHRAMIDERMIHVPNNVVLDLWRSTASRQRRPLGKTGMLMMHRAAQAQRVMQPKREKGDSPDWRLEGEWQDNPPDFYANEILDEALNSLDDRTRRVIVALRMDEKSGPEVAAMFGVTRQRINQIEAKGLRKLRERLEPYREAM